MLAHVSGHCACGAHNIDITMDVVAMINARLPSFVSGLIVGRVNKWLLEGTSVNILAICNRCGHQFIITVRGTQITGGVP